MQDKFLVEAWSLLDYTNKIVEGVSKGYVVDQDSNEGMPILIGTYLRTIMTKPLEDKSDKVLDTEDTEQGEQKVKTSRKKS